MSDKDDENVKTKQQQQERNFKMSVCQLVCEYPNSTDKQLHMIVCLIKRSVDLIVEDSLYYNNNLMGQFVREKVT